MVFHNFDELIAHVKGQPSRARMAVAAAGSIGCSHEYVPLQPAS